MLSSNNRRVLNSEVTNEASVASNTTAKLESNAAAPTLAASQERVAF